MHTFLKNREQTAELRRLFIVTNFENLFLWKFK